MTNDHGIKLLVDLKSIHITSTKRAPGAETRESLYDATSTQPAEMQ